MGRTTGGWAAIGGLAVVLWGCAPWDLAELEARHPALARVGSAPLHGLVPYFIASQDELVGFTCRWPTGTVIGVQIEGAATALDERILDEALVAWNQADLGVRFEHGQRPAEVEVRFADLLQGRSGLAAVDCLARRGTADRIDATLVFAALTLRREALDWKGQRVPLRDEERLGAALHELGHALGYQGHAPRGATVMLTSVDHVRWAGVAVRKGELFRDAALSALYALPSGTVLARRSLPPGRTQGLDAEAAAAAQRGQQGWWVRVGDRAARLHRGPGSGRFSVDRANEIFMNPEYFEAIPSAGP